MCFIYVDCSLFVICTFGYFRNSDFCLAFGSAVQILLFNAIISVVMFNNINNMNNNKAKYYSYYLLYLL